MSGITVGTALAIGGVAGAAGSIGSGLIGASAAGNAASTQANAANYAANLSHQDAQDALNFQKGEYGNALQMSAPWVQQGQGAITNMGYLMGIPGQYSMTPTSRTAFGGSTLGVPANYSGAAAPGGGAGITTTPNAPIGTNPNAMVGGDNSSPALDANGNPITVPPGAPSAPSVGDVPSLNLPTPQVNTALGSYGSLMTPWTQQFTAPTNVTEANDPGYRFRLAQGMKALDQGAAARGGLLSGGTAKAEQQFGQDYASNEYGNVYNRALGQYQQNYNIFKQNQADQFNRLAAMSGSGQTSAGQLTNAGQSTANNVSNTLMTSAGQIGSNINNAGAARASGYVGAANAWGGALGNMGNSLSQYATLYNMMGGGYDPTNNSSGLPGSQSWMLGPCWIAAELYGGWMEPRTQLVRNWLVNVYEKTPVGKIVVGLYRRFGQRIAARMKHSSALRALFRPLFNLALPKAVQSV